jgi:hypothetical protein
MTLAMSLIETVIKIFLFAGQHQDKLNEESVEYKRLQEKRQKCNVGDFICY